MALYLRSQLFHLPLQQQQQHSSFLSTSTLSHTSLPYPNTASSTIYIRDACKQGKLKQAFLSVAHSIQFPPPQEAYSSVLELCASIGASFEGQQLHSHILKSNSFLSDGFLSTKLVFMYGKCGRLLHAEKLFDEMPHLSVFTWNALIGAYASAGHSPLAVASYQEMRFSGIFPDACTLASVLKACVAADRICIGIEIHGLAVKSGLDVTGFVSNALVSMYARCGHFSSARQLFKRMGVEKDVVSWNSMMSACLQYGQFFETLNLFREMQKDGIPMNSYTAVHILQACTELSLTKMGMEMHAYFLKNTCKLHIFVRNALVVLYARCGLIGNAVRVFNKMNERDNVSWNSMLSGYVQNGLYQESIEFFNEAIRQGFKPDQVSLVNIASASGRLGNILNGKELHAYAIKHGFDADLQVGNTLMDMYTKCHFLGYAEHVFHEMHSKDCISWTTMIAGYAQSGYYSKALELSREVQKDGMELDPMMVGSILQACSGLGCLPLLKQVHGYAIRNRLLDLVLTNTIVDAYGEYGKVCCACHVFRMLQDKDVISWTSMITCYANNGLLNEALSLFKEMVQANVEPDAVSLISILAATSRLSSHMKGKQIHAFLYRRQLVTDGTALSNSLVDMYAKCGDIENAFKVFDNVISRDLVLWTTMINACGLHGRGEEAISLFRKMLEMDIMPDHVAFLALLYACSHSGLISEGKHYLEKMTSEYGLEPWPEHYACLVDLLGRSGKTEAAYNFIKSMPVEPTAVVWCALLGACRVHQHHKLSKFASEKLLELEPETSGNYVLVSNVFAAMGEWKDVNAVRRVMEDRGLKKDPACSWIEVGNRVHTFVARDTSHKDSAAIYAKLAEVTEKLKREGGYVEDTRFVLHDVTEEEKMRMLHGHSERLAIVFGMLYAPRGSPVRITKNLRVCGDCHEFTRLVTKFYGQEIIVRDANRFHHFKGGSCSCGNFCNLSDDKDFLLDSLLISYETTSLSVSMAAYFLGQCPQALEQLKVVDEIQRCGNIGKFLHKKALKDVRFEEYLIPGGWKVLPFLSAVHLDPSIHGNPQECNP